MSSIPPHHDDNAVLEEAHATLLQAEEEDARLARQGYYLPHIEAEFQGMRVRGVGSRVYVTPLKETFAEFLIHHLLWTLGKDWFDAQRRPRAEERHFIMQCWDKYCAWSTRNVTEATALDSGYSASMDGWTRSLVSLATDVYALAHRGELPKALLNRLKSRDQYQGARYEIAIAAMFVRLGCSIRFLDRSTSDRVATHCEFIATHRATGVEIGVEAKSRHRRGVLHTTGAVDGEAVLRGDIKNLLDDAVSRGPAGMPFLIFIDVNSPPDAGGKGDISWVAEAGEVIKSRGFGTAQEPLPFNGIFVTNYAFHYATEREASRSQYLGSTATHARNSLPNAEFIGYLKQGLDNYGTVPDLR
jgi:hypothetical protein